jgi:hypothetical protein
LAHAPATHSTPVWQSRLVTHSTHACFLTSQRGKGDAQSSSATHLTHVSVSGAQRGAAAGHASSLTHSTHRLRVGSQAGVRGEASQSALLAHGATQRKVARSQAKPVLPQFSELRHSTQFPVAVAQ